MNASHTLSRFRFLHVLVAVFAALFVLSTAQVGHAAGRVVWKATTIKERTSNESWNLEMEIHLPKAPDIAYKSMKFEFTQTSEFESSLVDGVEGPQTRTVPLTNQQSLIETVTVGFMDPGTGKTQNRTRFSFKITRAHGYKAGQWSVKIRDSDTGNQVGNVQTLTLDGQNPVVDRRAITFHGGEKKKPKEEAKPPGEEAPADMPEEEPYMGEPEPEGQVPPSVEEKPGGGCHYAPNPGGPVWFLAGLVLGAALLARRRS